MSYTGTRAMTSADYASRTLSMTDGQDGPRATVRHSEDSGSFVFSNSLVTSAVSSSATESLSGTVKPNLDAYTSLKEHMGDFPAYFDSSIGEEDRLKWATENLAKELVQFEEKRLKFEEDREAWLRDMEALKAKRLLALRREVVRLWMQQEEENWAVSRDAWAIQKKTLEGMLEEDLNNLRIREGSNLQNTPMGGGGAVPRKPAQYTSAKR